jgi:hypothetical protein
MRGGKVSGVLLNRKKREERQGSPQASLPLAELLVDLGFLQNLLNILFPEPQSVRKKTTRKRRISIESLRFPLGVLAGAAFAVAGGRRLWFEHMISIVKRQH